MRGFMSEANAAVLDRPDVQTDATASDADDAKALPESTDDSAQVETVAGDAKAKDAPEGVDADAEDDHEAQLERERIEARAEEIAAQKLTERAEEDRVKREAAAETSRKTRAKEARKTAFDSTTALADPKDGRLLAYVDPTDGTYTAVPAKNFTDVVDRLALDVEQAADLNVQAKWWAGIERSLPDDADQKAFDEWRGDGRPIHEVIDWLAEKKAPKSEWAKGLTLDDAMAMSPSLKKAVADLKDAEFKAGRAKGQGDKGKNPDAKERGVVAGQPSNQREADEWFAASPKDSAAISQLRSYRARLRMG